MDIAYQRLLALEGKFNKKHEITDQYLQFMDEFVRLGHMEEVSHNKIGKRPYFLLHHCVLKPDTRTTKLQVDFVGSSNNSLNYQLTMEHSI